MAEFPGCKIKHFKFTEEIEVVTAYATLTFIYFQFLGTSAKAMPPIAPCNSNGGHLFQY